MDSSNSSDSDIEGLNDEQPEGTEQTLSSFDQCTKLIIGDLPLDESLLTDFIKECETPLNVTLQKDSRGRPSSYAIVEFKTHQEAAHVIQELNYTKFDGIPIRISWFIKNRDRNANVFVKNLDESIEVAQLHEAFSNFGEVLSCKIPRNSEGKSCGYGFVQFVRREDAEEAVKSLTGAYIENKPITVELYTPHMHMNVEQTFTNVYIKNLPNSFQTDEDVKKLFMEYGEVQSVKLDVDKQFAICKLATHEQAVAAIEGLNGKQLDGAEEPLVVSRMMSKRERELELAKQTRRFRNQMYQQTKDRNFYIRNFGDTTTEEELKEFFSKFGEVESIKVVESENSYYRCAYLLYKEKESADALMKESANIKIGGQTPYIAYFKPAERRRIENARHNIPNANDNVMTSKAKDKVRIAIIEEAMDRDIDEDAKRSIIMSVKYLSEEQAAELNKDYQTFSKWFNSRLEDYEKSH